MKFTLEIATGNDEFVKDPEGAVADKLRTVAGLLADGFIEGTIRDLNGNLVGSYRLEGEDK